MKNILLVEDKDELRDLLAKFLKGSGYDVFAVKSGEDALRLLTELKIDLLFADIRLSGISGFQLFNTLKSKIDYDLPCVFMSAHVSHKVLEEAVSLRVNGVLEKPFKNRDLLAMIEKAISHPQQKLKEAFLDDMEDRFIGVGLDSLLHTTKANYDL